MLIIIYEHKKNKNKLTTSNIIWQSFLVYFDSMLVVMVWSCVGLRQRETVEIKKESEKENEKSAFSLSLNAITLPTNGKQASNGEMANVRLI